MANESGRVTAKITEEQIRKRAYEIWEASNRDGDPLQHWFEARMELEREADVAQEQQPPIIPGEPSY